MQDHTAVPVGFDQLSDLEAGAVGTLGDSGAKGTKRLRTRSIRTSVLKDEVESVRMGRMFSDAGLYVLQSARSKIVYESVQFPIEIVRLPD